MNLDFSKEALKSGSSYVSRKFSLNFLHSYFNIDNTFVYKKILMIFFPFTFNWEDDSLTRPDLYIPIMSFFTYILVKGMYYGLLNNFLPEKIGLIFTRLIFLEIVICFIVKGFSYFMNIKIRSLDMLCFSGYKYFTILFLQLVPKIIIIRFIIKGYFYTSFFFFLSRSLKSRLFNEFSNEKIKKIYFIFGFVFMQICFVFIFS
ncbi:protein transport protein YIF1 [Vairimorpha necatrix]|uniref:Protein YIF1 n=1 Tax=Vairimorpha necatrix TaxID=6039 RepID=A0AAX4JAI3_9MICR